MTVTETEARTPVMRKMTWTRRILGILIVLVTAAFLVVFGASIGTTNVFLRTHFGDPALGVFLVLALSIPMLMLLSPVQNEVTQYWRSRVRTIQVVVAFLALIVWGFVQALPYFDYNPEIIAHSPDGTRAAALVTSGTSSKDLHVLVGKGLSAKDVGDAGLACGGEDVLVTFARDNSSMRVETDFGTYTIHLDPTTGRPLDQLPAQCGG